LKEDCRRPLKRGAEFAPVAVWRPPSQVERFGYQRGCADVAENAAGGERSDRTEDRRELASLWVLEKEQRTNTGPRRD